MNGPGQTRNERNNWHHNCKFIEKYMNNIKIQLIRYSHVVKKLIKKVDYLCDANKEKTNKLK